MLPTNVKIKICKTITFPVVLYGCETYPLTLREDQRLKVFVTRVLRILNDQSLEKIAQ
jgi:hypothetical protein